MALKIYTAQEANETGIIEISGKVFNTNEYVGVGEKGEKPKGLYLL